MLPGSYIVRIYRRGEDDPWMVVGVVEEVGAREKKGFHDIEELRLILGLPTGQPIRQQRIGRDGGADRGETEDGIQRLRGTATD